MNDEHNILNLKHDDSLYMNATKLHLRANPDSQPGNGRSIAETIPNYDASFSLPLPSIQHSRPQVASRPSRARSIVRKKDGVRLENVATVKPSEAPLVPIVYDSNKSSSSSLALSVNGAVGQTSR